MLQITVPPLGESIVETTVAKWLKKEGEAVASGETLVELETDKITVEVPAPKNGAISKQVATEGSVVKVGDLIAEFDETAKGATASAPKAEAAPPAAAPAPAAAPPPTPAPAPAPAPAAAAPTPTATPVDGDGVKSSPAARRVATEAGID